MSLKIWLPLNGTLENKGISNCNITNSGATINNSGKINKCYSFDGTSNYIDIANYNLSNLAQLSVTFWCYPTNNFDHIFLVRNSGGTHQFKINSTGVVFRDSNNSTLRTIALGQEIPTNIWTHIACIYNHGEIFIYQNGIQTNHSTTYYHNNSVLNNNLTELRIARAQASSGNYYYTGKLNDFHIYDHALSAAEVKEIAQGLVLHYKLNQSNLNLIPNSTFYNTPWESAIAAHEEYQGRLAYRISNSILYNNTNKGVNDLFSGNIIYQENTQYTLSVTWRDDYRTDNKNSSMKLRIIHSDGTSVIMTSSSSTLHEWVHKKITSTAGKTVSKITTTYGNGGYLYITDLKLEIGTLDTGMNFKDVIEDSSGYNNNGTIIGDLVTNDDTPCYSNSVEFNGSNSAIKVIDNNWVVQGAREMTINLWAKSSSWSGAHLFSCTQSGGFNTENGNSGYLRFPVHAYTNAEQTSTAYKYDSKEIQISALSTTDWNMLTFVYDSTGSKTYINGNLHHTYAYTSYGIHFNTSARLFLGCEANTASPTTPYFNGQMSDFRIYCTSLSESDIKLLYNTRMKIDNLQNIHTLELNENGTNKLTKTGILYDNIVEPYLTLSDGSNWKLLLYHYVDNGNNLFTRTNATYCNDFGLYSRLKDINNYTYGDKYEFYVIQDGIEYRWTQTSQPTASSIAGLTTVSGYTNPVNGLAKANSNTYIGYGSWWGACGCWTKYSTGGKTGIPGFGPHDANGVCTKYLALYTRINKPYASLINLSSEANEFIER